LRVRELRAEIHGFGFGLSYGHEHHSCLIESAASMPDTLAGCKAINPLKL